MIAWCHVGVQMGQEQLRCQLWLHSPTAGSSPQAPGCAHPSLPGLWALTPPAAITSRHSIPDSKQRMLLQPKKVFKQSPGNLNMQRAFPGRASTRGHGQALGPSTKETESSGC